MAHGSSADPRRPFRSGDPVLVRFGDRTLRGTVVEDRGPLGAGGRQIYRVRVTLEEPIVFEVPADDLSHAPRGGTRRAAVA